MTPYRHFINDADKNVMSAVRAATPEELSGFDKNFRDARLKALLPLYKARNFPDSLDNDERVAWESFCASRLVGGGQESRLATFMERLQALATLPGITQNQQYLLEELHLYGESIAPVPE